MWGEGPGGKLRGEPILMMINIIFIMINDDDNDDEDDLDNDFDNDGKCAACWADFDDAHDDSNYSDSDK